MLIKVFIPSEKQLFSQCFDIGLTPNINNSTPPLSFFEDKFNTLHTADQERMVIALRQVVCIAIFLTLSGRVLVAYDWIDKCREPDFVKMSKRRGKFEKQYQTCR